LHAAGSHISAVGASKATPACPGRPGRAFVGPVLVVAISLAGRQSDRPAPTPCSKSLASDCTRRIQSSRSLATSPCVRYGRTPRRRCRSDDAPVPSAHFEPRIEIRTAPRSGPLRKFLLRRLQSGRVEPVIHMGRRVGLLGILEKHIAVRTWAQFIGLLTDFVCPCGKPISKRNSLFETTPLKHGALLSTRGRRERNWRSHHR
jgi:hypothetical protein